jgi:hypothetical protein
MRAKTAPAPNVPNRATRSQLLDGAAELGAVSTTGAIDIPFNDHRLAGGNETYVRKMAGAPSPQAIFLVN